MAGYVGNVPVPQSVREDQSFTATAGQTTFNTLGYTDGNRIKVTLNGVLLEGGGVDYTATNGSDVVLTVAAVVDDIVRFETFNEVQLVSNTSTTPIFKTNLTLKNDTEEDTDGGRESTVIFQGEQSGGEITTLAEIEASHDGTADDQKGDLIFRTNDGNDGTSPTERLRINSGGDMLFSSEDPSLTLANTTHEDSDGGRESTIAFQGEQSGGEVSTLAQIEAAHDGTADDQKGDLIFRTNDGSDGASPTETLRLKNNGNLLLGTTVAGRAAEGADRLTIADTSHSGMTIRSGVNSYGSINFSDSEGGAGEYAGQLWYGHGSLGDKLVMAVGGVNKVTVDGDGLKFNADTAAANALDDYETGTFQMSVAGVSGGARGYGIYTKIGEVVHFQWYSGGMTVTSATPTLSGLPFNAVDPFNNGAYPGFIAYHNTYVTNANTGYINLNGTTMYFTALGSTGGPTISTGSSKYVMVSGTYYTNV